MSKGTSPAKRLARCIERIEKARVDLHAGNPTSALVWLASTASSLAHVMNTLEDEHGLDSEALCLDRKKST